MTGWPAMMAVSRACASCWGSASPRSIGRRASRCQACHSPRDGGRTAPEALLTALAGLAWGGVNLGLVIFFSFGPALLETRGIDPVGAGLIIGLGLW